MAEEMITRRSALKFASAIMLAAHGWRGFAAEALSSSARGYGPDPDVLKRTVTWPCTLSSPQLTLLEALCMIVLPAEPPHPSAGALGVHEFLDEWVSAPYPQMRADRVLLLKGLAALDETMHREHGISFNEANLSQQAAIFDQSCSSEASVEFARRLIELICSGYYTTREGHAAIGYVGNIGLTTFPAPDPDVVRRFERTLDELLRAG